MIFSQWFIAISFGQLIAGWYIAGLYQPIEPKMSCVGHKKYEDNIEFYIKESEVHIAQYWDAGERRNKIERIYKFCKKVLLLQLIISFIFLVF
jgi:hypothetical protein